VLQHDAVPSPDSYTVEIAHVACHPCPRSHDAIVLVANRKVVSNHRCPFHSVPITAGCIDAIAAVIAGGVAPYDTRLNQDASRGVSRGMNLLDEGGTARQENPEPHALDCPVADGYLASLGEDTVESEDI